MDQCGAQRHAAAAIEQQQQIRRKPRAAPQWRLDGDRNGIASESNPVPRDLSPCADLKLGQSRMLGFVKVRPVLILCVIVMCVAGCGPATAITQAPDVEGTVSARVQSTVTAMAVPLATTPPTPTSLPLPQPTSRPTAMVVPPTLTVAPEMTPEQTAQRFYELISSKDLRAAWDLQSPNRQNSLKYDGWVAAYRFTRSVQARVASQEQTSSRASVVVSITAVDAQGTGTVTKTFEGTWNLVLLDNTWRLDTASIVETTHSPTPTPTITLGPTAVRTATAQPRLEVTSTPVAAIPFYGGGGCGSRGGPGYRLPSGKCASWRDAGRP